MELHSVENCEDITFWNRLVISLDNINKLEYDCFTGTYWLQDEEWEEPREFTADELITEGIYLNEYCQRI